ncbi:MAG: hypothetical protein C4324_12490 [Blastocatellia bacterium]
MKSLVNFASSLSLIAVFVFALAIVGASAQTRNAAQRSENKGKARITLEQARQAALAEAVGKIESEELEKEKGKWVYSFDIRNSKGTITEIWIDAKTGAVIHKAEEDAASEAKEKTRDKKKGRRESGERRENR